MQVGWMRQLRNNENTGTKAVTERSTEDSEVGGWFTLRWILHS